MQVQKLCWMFWINNSILLVEEQCWSIDFSTFLSGCNFYLLLLIDWAFRCWNFFERSIHYSIFWPFTTILHHPELAIYTTKKNHFGAVHKLMMYKQRDRWFSEIGQNLTGDGHAGKTFVASFFRVLIEVQQNIWRKWKMETDFLWKGVEIVMCSWIQYYGKVL